MIAASTPPEPVDIIDGPHDTYRGGPPKRIGIVGVVAIVVLAGLGYAFAQPYARLRDLLVAAVVGMPVHLLGFVAAGVVAGLTIERVSLFYGGALVRRRVRGAWVTVGWLPLGGWVKFAGQDEALDPPLAVPLPGSWPAAHPLVRAAVALAGPLALVALASIAIGPSAAVEHFIRTFGQTIDVLRGVLPARMEQFFRFVDAADVVTVAGVTLAKFAALNALPLPFCNGGQALLDFGQWIARRQLPRRVSTMLLTASLAVFCVLALYGASTALKAWPVAD